MMYRLNFVMWRIRVVVQVLTVYFLWLAIFPEHGELFGYTQSSILTYTLGVVILTSFIFASRSGEIGEEINKGEISKYLVKPINYLLYQFARDMGDKVMNILFMLIEIMLIMIFLHPPFLIQSNPLLLLFTIFSVCIAIFINYCINVLLGFMGFWTPEVWAPRFIYFIIQNFFTGFLFPLDILPSGVTYGLSLLPFPYLLYFPLKIYLGQLSAFEILMGFTVSLLWCMGLFYLVHIFWLKGLRTYGAEGQ